MEVKAAVCRRFAEPLAIEEITLAEPGQGEVRVSIKACAICHSDITYADGGWGGNLPIVFGHEAAGVVEKTGPGVTRFQPGDHVVVTLIRSCGCCHYCSGGDGYLCETITPLDETSPITDSAGKAVGHGLRTGAFAEACVVDQSQIVKVPNDIRFDVASLLACGIITGVGAVTNTVRMQPGSNCVVIGCGGVGLSTVQGARMAGAAHIIAMDIVGEKREAALSFGATHAVDPRDPDAARSVMDITGNRGADHVFVTVGSGPVIESAFSYLGKKGAVVIVGMPASDVTTSFNPASFAGYGQSIIGSKMGSARIARDIPWLIGQYRQGRLKLDEMISGRYRLEEINEAIAATKAGRSIRNVIVFD